MQLGLFVRRALITSVRRGNAFYDRVTAVILVPALVAGCVLFWDQCGWDRTSVAGAAWFGHSAFCLIVLVQALLVTAVVYGQVAPSIASERDRKSLDGLLATRLSAAEIVLGMMVTGLVRCANWLAAALPVVILVAIVGGVQPLLVMLTAAGLGSSCFRRGGSGGRRLGVGSEPFQGHVRGDRPVDSVARASAHCRVPSAPRVAWLPPVLGACPPLAGR